jgi:hypothetical protein
MVEREEQVDTLKRMRLEGGMLEMVEEQEVTVYLAQEDGSLQEVEVGQVVTVAMVLMAAQILFLL